MVILKKSFIVLIRCSRNISYCYQTFWSILLLIEIQIFCDNTNVFMVTFVSLLCKIMHFLKVEW